ncbi:hypothetical protein [Alkaliphilus crotonatoxidans]
MNNLEVITNICEAYKYNKFEIEEFQSRLETVLVSDEYKEVLSKVLFDAINRLEEIRFTELESNFRRYGQEVADALIKSCKSAKGTE